MPPTQPPAKALIHKVASGTLHCLASAHFLSYANNPAEPTLTPPAYTARHSPSCKPCKLMDRLHSAGTVHSYTSNTSKSCRCFAFQAERCLACRHVFSRSAGDCCLHCLPNWRLSYSAFETLGEIKSCCIQIRCALQLKLPAQATTVRLTRASVEVASNALLGRCCSQVKVIRACSTASNMLTPCLNSRVRSAFWGNACPSRAQTVRQQTKVCVRVTASLSGKGKRFPAELITVKKIMGEGSYGQVFEVPGQAARQSAGLLIAH